MAQQHTSYTSMEMIYGARFVPMFYKSDDGSTAVLAIDKINKHEPAALPEIDKSAINA